MKRAFFFYFKLYLKFGIRAVLFLIKAKFKKTKTGPLHLKGVKHPVTLSNFDCDVTTLFQIFYAREYEIEAELDDSTIIDCGANIGLSAIWFANTFPNARIIAVEPDPNNFHFLQKNTKLYANISCLNKAVWPYETVVEIKDRGTGSWSLQTIETVVKDDHGIEAMSITSLMEQFNIDFIDLLKIDIEGAEKELFRKNYETWLLKTGIIAIELHDNIDKEIPAVFFKAISSRKYKKYYNGENLICDFR